MPAVSVNESMARVAAAGLAQPPVAEQSGGRVHRAGVADLDHVRAGGMCRLPTRSVTTYWYMKQPLPSELSMYGDVGPVGADVEEAAERAAGGPVERGSGALQSTGGDARSAIGPGGERDARRATRRESVRVADRAGGRRRRVVGEGQVGRCGVAGDVCAGDRLGRAGRGSSRPAELVGDVGPAGGSRHSGGRVGPPGCGAAERCGSAAGRSAARVGDGVGEPQAARLPFRGSRSWSRSGRHRR